MSSLDNKPCAGGVAGLMHAAQITPAVSPGVSPTQYIMQAEGARDSEASQYGQRGWATMVGKGPARATGAQLSDRPSACITMVPEKAAYSLK